MFIPKLQKCHAWVLKLVISSYIMSYFKCVFQTHVLNLFLFYAFYYNNL